jgi:biotin operon repressor
VIFAEMKMTMFLIVGARQLITQKTIKNGNGNTKAAGGLISALPARNRKGNNMSIKNNVLRALETHRAVKQCTLANLFDTTDRQIRKAVRELREEGNLIGSDEEGYFLASTREEILHTINRLKCQVRSHVDLIFLMEEVLKKMETAE